MAKEKQARRLIAMALAASVATSVVPVTAFAEGDTTVTNNADGSTTTTTTNSDGSSTSTTTGTTGEGTVSAPTVTATITISKDANGETTSQNEKTETSYSDTDSFGNTTNSTSTNESWSSTTNNVPQDVQQATPSHPDANKNEATPAPDSVKPAPGTPLPGQDYPDDPTGNGENKDLNNDGVIDDTDKFVSDFQEGTTITDTTTVNGSNQENHKDVENIYGEDTENSGNVSGSETTTNTVVKVEKEEQHKEIINGEAQPEGEQPKDEETVIKDFTNDGTGEEWTDTTTGLPSGELPYDPEMDLTGSITVDDPTTEVDESQITVTEKLYQDWKETYNKLVNDAANKVNTAAAADAATTKDAGDNTVTLTVGAPSVSADGTTTTYTGTGVTADGKADIVKTVVVTKVTDEKGNVTFKTTATVVTTPKTNEDGSFDELISDTTVQTDKEFSGEAHDPYYSYEFGDLESSEPVTKTVVKLPAKPQESVVTDETTKHTQTTTVEEIKEMIDGVETVVGYKKVVVLTNENGDVIGGGSETLMGEKSTVTTTKEVEKTTTIDTYTQQTVVTQKTITKEVSESEVTMNVDTVDNVVLRELIVKLLSANTNYDQGHGDIEKLVSILPDKNTYGTSVDGDDLYNYDQWETNGGTALPDNVVVGDSLFKLLGYGLYSDLLVGRTDKYGEEGNYQTRQYILRDSEGNNVYTYCVEMGQGLNWNSDYVVENLDEVDYFKGGETAKEHIRVIALNGFWGTTGNQKDMDGNEVKDANGASIPATGSMEAVKAMLKENGWKDDEVATLTPGQALAATQAAIWYYGNDGGQKITDMDHIIKYSFGTWAGVGETDDDNTNVVKMFNTLIGLSTDVDPEDKESNLIDLEDITATITAKEMTEKGTEDINNDGKIDNKYNTDVSFTLAVLPGEKDQMTVVVVDSNNNVLVQQDLSTFGSTGNNVKTTDANGNTTYTMKNIELTEGVTINLSIDGTQHLKNGVYVYRSENFDTSNVDEPHSQTLIGIAEGKREVSLDMNLTFAVTDPADVDVDGRERDWTDDKKIQKTSKTNRKETDKVVTALMEVTTTTTTTEERDWSGEYKETWSPNHNGGGELGGDELEEVEPTTPTEPTPDEPTPDKPTPEDPGNVLGDEEELEDIGDEEAPLDDLLLGDEEEIIAATGDSNHMTAAAGGMFAALAGMLMLRRKKEN